jgi:hypothetical protein
MTCKSGALTQDGGKFSSMMRRRTNSSIGVTTRSSKSLEAKTKKEQRLVSTVTTMEETNNGQFFMLTRPTKLRLRDLMRNSVSTLINLSTLSPNFHSTELLK